MRRPAAIARKRLYDAGIDPKKDDAKPVFSERAYQERRGRPSPTAYSSWLYKISARSLVWIYAHCPASASIRADKFGDLFGALDDNDVGKVVAKNGKTWTAADFKKAAPVCVNGGYAFALGDPSSTTPQFIADADGNPSCSIWPG